ncbi:MAG: tetratricopeptide repeat-containing sensor histidine kinase [Bacteroidales bacterium]|jgi:signal transduction histidine kinase|nr:tetratricopeptide repeat-containing sensor histidine kinase [Bacteroidales bacterium]
MSDKKIKEIYNLAKRTQAYCDLLIKQCDNWQAPPDINRLVSNKKKKSNRKRNFSVIIIIITTFLINITISANNIDSLFNEFEQSETDVRIRIANKLLKELDSLNIFTIEKSFTGSHSQTEINADVYTGMACYCSQHGRYDESINLYEKGIAGYRLLNDSLNICRYLQNLYVSYSVIGDFDKAYTCLEESLHIADSINNPIYIAYGLLATGDFYFRNKHFSLSEDYLNKAYKLYKQIDDAEMAVATLERLSGIYWQLEKKDKIKNIVEELKYWKTKELSPMSRFTAHLIDAEACKEPGKWDIAFAYLDSCLMISEAEAMIDYTIAVLTHISELCMISGRPEKAEEPLLRCKNLCIENQRQIVLQMVYRQLYMLNKDVDLRQALAYLEEYTNLSDTLYKQQMQEQLAGFHVKYETAEKESQILLHKSQIERHGTQRRILFAGFAFAILILIMLVYILKLRTKRNRILTEMNATKDKFFSIISHDLKNPAIAQRNAIQVMLSNLDKLNNNTLMQYCSALLKSADEQVELLYNLLNWAQLQTGRMPFRPSEFDLSVIIVHEIKGWIQTLLDEKNIQIQYNEIPDEVIACADRNMTATVVRNLLVNAIKFSYPGSVINVSVDDYNDRIWIVSICDTGIGMSPERTASLFNIDAQRSTIGTAGEEGSGLGLTVCKEMVEQNGGQIWVKSEEGKGSCFSFTVMKIN